MPGWLQNLLAILIGGAASGVVSAGTGASLRVVGLSAAVGAVTAVSHLNVQKND